jgi:hypothetical protein
LLSIDKRTHHVVLYITIAACLLSGLYGMAKLDRHAALRVFNEPSPGDPRHKDELKKCKELAEASERKNKWRSEIAFGLCIVLLFIIIVLRGE